MKRFGLLLFILLLNFGCGSAWLTQSDGYNIGVTVGSALAGLILLVILFFIIYYCCLKGILMDYRRDKGTFKERNGSGGPGPLYKKGPKQPYAREYPPHSGEYKGHPSKLSNESFGQHSGGYYSDGFNNGGASIEEYRQHSGAATPVDYGAGPVGVARTNQGYSPKEMDSSTESKGSVKVAGYDDRDREPGAGRAKGYIAHYDEPPGEPAPGRGVLKSSYGKYGDSREPKSGGYDSYSGSGRGSAPGSMVPASHSRPASNTKSYAGDEGITTVSGTKKGGGGISSVTESYTVGPVTAVAERTEQHQTPTGGHSITYQTVRTTQQRTVQKTNAAAAYMGSSV